MPRTMDNFKKFKILYESELNVEQLSTVLEVKNSLMVITGTRSGKTRVITYKVSYHIEKGYLPEAILLLTFTRKALKEMLNRVDSLLKGSYSEKIFGGIFHSFSNNVLRKYRHLVNLPPNFTIIDTLDSINTQYYVKYNLYL